MPGRKRKPTELHILSGAYKEHPNRRPANEPPTIRGVPDPPNYLDSVAREKFVEVCGFLDAMGVCSPIYLDLIAEYAVTWSLWRKATEKVNQLGIAIVRKDKNGQVEIVRNPFEIASRNHTDRLVRIAAELGLTPTSKSRLQVPEARKKGIASRDRTRLA